MRRTALRALLIALAGLAIAPPTAARAQTSSGSEGALFLLLPVGARSVGMSRAVTATTGAESVWWNPAGLAGLEQGRFDVFRGRDLAGDATSLTLLTARDAGVLGVSYLLFDLGTVDLRDDQGNFLGTASFRNHVGMVSAGGELLPGLALGLNFKLIQSRISCRGECLDAGITATTWAVDLGAQWRNVGTLPITLAGALVHAGGELQVVNGEQADPLPARIRLAAAWHVLDRWVDIDGLDATLTVELEDRWRDPGSPATYVGAEFSAGKEQALYVRAGYAFGAELQVDGAAVGVGVRYDRIDLGIAKSLASSSLVDDSDPVQISFGFLF